VVPYTFDAVLNAKLLTAMRRAILGTNSHPKHGYELCVFVTTANFRN
jgi:hypothetical protein